MQTLEQIRGLLETHGLAPRKSLGQNFLVDQNLGRKLVDSAAVVPGDVVLEVGPGTGTLTEELLARGALVVACELDDGLAGMLRRRAETGEIPGAERLSVVHADCLDGRGGVSGEVLGALRGLGAAERGFKLVANLPYGAATGLMTALMEGHPECRLMAVTVQNEVVERLTARSGTKAYGLLSVVAQALFVAERVAKLPPECFWPRPGVTSAMAVLRAREQPLTRDRRGLFRACAVLFSGRRKQLGGVLKRAGVGVAWDEIVARMGAEAPHETDRSESLTPERIVALGRAIGMIDAGAEGGMTPG